MFEALGLSVEPNMNFACRLNDLIAQEFQFTLSGDDADVCKADACSLVEAEIQEAASGRFHSQGPIAAQVDFPVHCAKPPFSFRRPFPVGSGDPVRLSLRY
ncbi:hypothetical protein M3484_20365 [Pseudomonas sp. GX19020]|uniref:hypothetical protein n=1 Tax=Pseudomonas sp. GX19020 TaxID=2942277 RepID=UPI0020185BFC|nr:hypothetical protein [Pseudomonas sp. GX19020]MCL4068918.1 hypothetical protein [Pseudomonas sp. GX19020]